jgi:prepilin-type N-terminal cleavage/methylation domain-containing protein
MLDLTEVWRMVRTIPALIQKGTLMPPAYLTRSRLVKRFTTVTETVNRDGRSVSAPRISPAFTLIELLVVIAIIAILAAILFPVFAKAREKARQASCQSNEKQIGLAILQYVQDYDETYPAGAPNLTYAGWPILGTGWAGEVFPYVKSTGVYKCPDDSTSQAVGTGGATLYPVSYGMNGFVGGKTLATVAAPATVVLGSEVTAVTAYINFPDEGVSEGLKPTQLSATTTGYSVDGCGVGCGGRDNAGTGGFDIWSGVTTSATAVTAQAKSGALNATANTYAKHDPQATPKIGFSEYVMCDGHVKFIKTEVISSGITPCTNPGGTTFGTSINMGGFAYTYCPQ